MNLLGYVRVRLGRKRYKGFTSRAPGFAVHAFAPQAKRWLSNLKKNTRKMVLCVLFKEARCDAFGVENSVHRKCARAGHRPDDHRDMMAGWAR